jgi:acyl-CoA reductase-like NAD-dependent aldehyde dehydrogenase
MNQPGNSTYLHCISPVDGSIYAERELANTNSIAQSIELSRSAQKQWQKTSLTERAGMCEIAVQYFESNRERIAEEIAWQIGRPIAFAGGEVKGLAERARHMIAIAEHALADMTPALQTGFKRFIRRMPVGTVFTIAPWNYPLLTAVNSIVPALMAGNSVILKPSAQAPLCGEHFVKAFELAGLPDGVIQCLFLDHENTVSVINSGQMGFTCFTGSVTAGRQIEQAAAGTFSGVGLELGGKDPAYVMADADLDSCVEDLVDGAFFNSGQSCCGIERIYVHQALFDRFVEAYVERVRQYILGNPLDLRTTLGPVVRTAAADWIRNQVSEAIAKGAKACIDRSHFPDDRGNTPYLAPQVLIDVDHEMSVMREESFGPVVGIMPVSDDEEAIRLMNDSDLGLTASLWTLDQARAEQLGNQLQVGTVFMNRCDYLDPALAWTGVKNTGRGVALSELGYHQLTQPKSFHMKN